MTVPLSSTPLSRHGGCPKLHKQPITHQWTDPRTREVDAYETALEATKALASVLAHVDRAFTEVEVVVRNARMQEASEQPRNVTVDLPDEGDVPANEEPYEWWLISPDHSLMQRIDERLAELRRLTLALERHHAQDAA